MGVLLSDDRIPKPLLEKADKDVAIITLIGGGDPNGQSFWAYIAIPPSDYQKLLDGEIDRTSNLESIGTVLCSGPGREPPEDIKIWMESQYGVNHNLLEDIEKSLKNKSDK